MKPAAGCAHRSVKTGVSVATASPGSTISYPDVLRALSSDETRSAALTAYRTAGFSPDDFAHRLAARAAMAEALTAVEDGCELRGSRREREAVRAVRRRLEREIWS